jgi:hypothetical protein
MIKLGITVNIAYGEKSCESLQQEDGIPVLDAARYFIIC